MPILKAAWSSDGNVIITAGERKIEIPAKVVPVGQIVKPDGNTKTEGVVGIINDLANGCFRSLTGFGKTDVPCYADASMGEAGCYANLTIYANLHRSRGYDVVSNGIDNDFMNIKVPKGGYSLEKWRGTRRLWREASETSDSSLAIALGLTREWASANPWAKIIGISSNYFLPEDSELEALASLGNVVVGHTISAWFAEDDMNNRLSAIRRYRDAGVPTAIWIATHPSWDNAGVAERALEIVRSEDIIEVPYHDAKGHMVHSLKINPKGMCSSVWTDRWGNKIDLETMTMKETGEPFTGTPSVKCRGCRLLCGCTYTLKGQNAAPLEEVA